MGCLVNIHLRSGDHSNAVCEVVEGKDNAEARRVLEHAGIWWRGGIGRVKTLGSCGRGAQRCCARKWFGRGPSLRGPGMGELRLWIEMRRMGGGAGRRSRFGS